MAEPIPDESTDTHKARFFSKDDLTTNPEIIGEHIWRYFSDKRRCVLGVPSEEIIDHFSLNRWWRSREKTEEQEELDLLKKLIVKYPKETKKFSQQDK